MDKATVSHHTTHGSPVSRTSRWHMLAGIGASLLVAAISAILLFRGGDGWATIVYPLLVLVLGVLWAILLRAFVKGNRQQERLLHDMHAQAKLLEETRRIAGIGDWTWEMDTGRVHWSEEIWRIHGRTEPADGLHIDMLNEWIHPDDLPLLRTHYADRLSGTDGTEIEFRIVRPGGEIRHVYARGEWIDRTPGSRAMRGIQQDITNMAVIRDRLLATQEEYEFLFQRNPLPMWVFDRESLGFLAVNDSMLESYGYTREELLGGNILDIRPPGDIDAVRAFVQLKPDDRLQGHVWTHLRKDGSRLRSAIHTRDTVFEGQPARLVLAEDVTERERSERRFQLIARATSDAVWDWDVVSGALWWSESFYTLFGYAHDDMAANIEAWVALIHPDDHDRVSASLTAAMVGGALDWEDSYRFRRGNGTYAEVLDRGFLLRNDEGVVVRAAGGMLDVTRQRRDEVDLRLLRRAVEATGNGIVIADTRQPDFPVVYVNPAFEEITGYSADEIQGTNCRILQGGDSDQSAVATIRDALVGKTEAQVLLRNYRKNGELFWNEFHMAPVADDHGVLTHYVGVINDVSERQRYEEQLAYRATHDELTGLPNRQLLHDRLQQAILNAERYGREVAVVFIDLDDFKLINDSLGHGAGDIALKTFATRLRDVVRDTDTVGRFGGDEFVIVLTEQTDDAGIERVLLRISDALRQPIELAGVSHVLTPSIGHCRYPQAGADAESLLKHADLAMYQAKRQGRNRAVAYRKEFDTVVSQRLQLVSRLREALHNGEFRLAFQPLFTPAGRLMALEALVRWQHPDRGLLLPGEFIGICEESGLIVDLGRYVLREACRHHALLAAVGLGYVRLSVNVSAAQFGHELYRDVAAAITEFALPPGVLELEITESVIMDNPERAIETMQRISALGVGISVDDFGTGYSSLSYLKRLPIDRLKIDRSFVQDLGHDEDDAAICASIIGLGHLMDLRVVAEGVETQEQLDWLRSRGCDELQGFLLGRPQPFDTLLPTLIGERVDLAFL
jgi:diguanylate cyclase (GGDEF)-like protein/PAS domain S-box-containing protein